MNYTADDFERAHKINLIVGVIFLALFIAVAILSTVPGLLNMIFGGLQ